jgi:hypothetical protein
MNKDKVTAKRWAHHADNMAVPIRETEDFIVFLHKDRKLVHWETSQRYDEERRAPEGWGRIRARYSTAESSFCDAVPDVIREKIQVMLGEAVDNALGGNVSLADEYIERAEQLIAEQNRDIGRLRNMQGAFITFAGVALVCLLLWICRAGVEPVLKPMVYKPIIYGGGGCVGAMLAALVEYRDRGITTDPNAAQWLHKLDGVLRILLGGLSGAVVALIVLTNAVTIHLAGKELGPYPLFVLCIVAGYKGLTPMLVERMASMLDGGKKLQKPSSSVRKRT